MAYTPTESGDLSEFRAPQWLLERSARAHHVPAADVAAGRVPVAAVHDSRAGDQTPSDDPRTRVMDSVPLRRPDTRAPDDASAGDAGETTGIGWGHTGALQTAAGDEADAWPALQPRRERDGNAIDAWPLTDTPADEWKKRSDEAERMIASVFGDDRSVPQLHCPPMAEEEFATLFGTPGAGVLGDSAGASAPHYASTTSASTAATAVAVLTPPPTYSGSRTEAVTAGQQSASRSVLPTVPLFATQPLDVAHAGVPAAVVRPMPMPGADAAWPGDAAPRGPTPVQRSWLRMVPRAVQWRSARPAPSQS